MSAKAIYITRHARFEMKRRGIRQVDVIAAIRIAQAYYVITAYKTSKIDKHWRKP
jgi:hypothetical protein